MVVRGEQAPMGDVMELGKRVIADSDAETVESGNPEEIVESDAQMGKSRKRHFYVVFTSE